jgi:hypothetical protein
VRKLQSIVERPDWLGDNMLTGSLPAGISSLVNLELLDLRNCSFVGLLPTGLSYLKDNLRSAFFNINGFSGPIPKEWVELTNLNLLNLGK